MIILFLNTMHTHNDKRLYYKEAISLSNQGHQVIILGPYGDVSSSDVNITIKGYGKTKYFKRLINTIHLFKSCWKEKADILQCNELDSWFVGVIIGKIKKIPVIFDAHEYYPSRFENKINTFIEKYLRLLLKLFMFILSLHTDLIITVSRQLAKDYKFLKCPIKIIHNYSLKFTNNINNIDIKEKYNKRHPILLSIGLISLDRGLKKIIKGISVLKKEYPQIICIIVGKNTDSIDTQKEIKKLIKKLNVEQNIDFIGWINFSNILIYLNIATIGLILFQNKFYNNKIGLPHKFFEYIRAGIPVIVPEGSILDRFVSKYNLGIAVDSSSYLSFAEGVRKIMKLYEDSMLNHEEIKTIADKNFSWENEGLKYTELLEVVFDNVNNKI